MPFRPEHHVMTRQMQSAGRGKQDRRERPSPFGRSRLTISDPRQAPGPNPRLVAAHALPGEEGTAIEGGTAPSIAEEPTALKAADSPKGLRSSQDPRALEVAETPEDLMAKVCRGDHEAFARLYDRFAGQAFGLALRVCNDRTVAEDAVQEAFLSLWRRPTGYRPDRGSVSTYLLTLVHHRAVDAVRHEQRLRVRERASAVGEQTEDDQGLVDAASVSGLRDRVRAALAQLTNRQRQALELAYFSGLTVSDVAKQLDIPLGTAKTRVRDGMIRLRSLLASEGEPG